MWLPAAAATTFLGAMRSLLARVVACSRGDDVLGSDAFSARTAAMREPCRFLGALSPSYEALAPTNVELARVRLGEVFGLVVVQGRPRFPRALADVSRSSRSRIDGGRDFESCG